MTVDDGIRKVVTGLMAVRDEIRSRLEEVMRRAPPYPRTPTDCEAGICGHSECESGGPDARLSE